MECGQPALRRKLIALSAFIIKQKNKNKCTNHLKGTRKPCFWQEKGNINTNTIVRIK